jgi:hypothetical protein
MNRESSIAEIVRTLKSNSSKWIHQEFNEAASFAWQAGYGAFSVSFSNLDGVKRYNANQEDHHRRMSFQDEFRALLRKHGIEWDERYVWD